MFENAAFATRGWMRAAKVTAAELESWTAEIPAAASD
jgi:hypothetical protein